MGICTSLVRRIYSCVNLIANIYTIEPQPTSSRWRALAHRYLHALYPGLEVHAINELVESILNWTSGVLFIAGATSESGQNPREALQIHFGARVHHIAQTVSKLARVMREDIMSTNFEVVLVEHGEVFDARRMADAFADYGASTGAILCTTELGLGCSTRRACGLPNSEPAAVERRLLLQPKVLLESAMDAINAR